MKRFKRWKRWTLLLLLGLFLLTQTPFIYRRFELRSLRAKIQELNSSRTVKDGDAYTDYKGVVHVHSQLGGHSTGSFADIITGARENNLAFVVMTEHPSAMFDTSELTLRGTQGGVLFINGQEVVSSSSDRFLILPGTPAAARANTKQTQELIAEEKAEGRMTVLAYPEDFHSWETARDYDGMEVYNLYTNARRINPLSMFFDGLWSYGSYADLLFTRFYERPSNNLKRWDEMNVVSGKRLVALAGNDAHQNVGVYLGDAGGKKFSGILLDPYARSFRIVRTHALIESGKALSADSLLEALRSGHCYIAFDVLSDSAGFRFTAEGGESSVIMGDSIALADGEVRLNVTTPIKARAVLFRNGQVVDSAPDVLTKEFVAKERGVYRVEVYLDALGSSFATRPWIISNPIYVE